uniref:Uncharacterized protein n=1 Tax=Octopus bimaculoides TaxID=37653 RepID=A0A0L8GC06_OCTBM
MTKSAIYRLKILAMYMADDGILISSLLIDSLTPYKLSQAAFFTSAVQGTVVRIFD